MRFDDGGQILAASELYEGLRIPRSTRAFAFPAGDRMAWVNGDAQGNRLLLHAVDTRLTLASYELGRGAVNPRRPRVLTCW